MSALDSLLYEKPLSDTEGLQYTQSIAFGQPFICASLMFEGLKKYHYV